MLTPTAPLALAIFLATVALVIAKPWRLTEAAAALLGAGAMVSCALAREQVLSSRARGALVTWLASSSTTPRCRCC